MQIMLLFFPVEVGASTFGTGVFVVALGAGLIIGFVGLGVAMVVFPGGRVTGLDSTTTEEVLIPFRDSPH